MDNLQLLTYEQVLAEINYDMNHLQLQMALIMD